METRPPLPTPGQLEPLKSTSKDTQLDLLTGRLLPSGNMPVSGEVFAPVALGTMPQEPQQTDFQLVRVKSTWCRIKKGEALDSGEDQMILSEAKM